MTDLIDTTEMYLRTILELEEENIVALRARIAERLRHSGPTVSQTVGRMERDGLVVVSGDRHLELTETGRKRAIEVMRKHRLAERLLADVIGLDWAYVHEEACRWEHVMSERVERRIFELLNRTVSPYGNPIPGLAELGGLPSQPYGDGVVNLLEAMAGYGPDSRVRVNRLGRAHPGGTGTARSTRRRRHPARRLGVAGTGGGVHLCPGAGHRRRPGTPARGCGPRLCYRRLTRRNPQLIGRPMSCAQAR